MQAMDRRLKFALMVFVVLLGVHAASAQQEAGQINGRIVNSRDNEPLALVQVDLSGTTFRAITGEDGTFHIAEVPAGTYVLQVATVGYYLTRQQFVLAPGE